MIQSRNVQRYTYQIACEEMMVCCNIDDDQNSYFVSPNKYFSQTIFITGRISILLCWLNQKLKMASFCCNAIWHFIILSLFSTILTLLDIRCNLGKTFSCHLLHILFAIFSA